jgi:hypothetical protein
MYSMATSTNAPGEESKSQRLVIERITSGVLNKATIIRSYLD